MPRRHYSQGKGERGGRRSAQLAHAAEDVSISLSTRQINQVLRKVTGKGGMRESLIEQVDDLRLAVNRVLDSPKFGESVVSRSTLHALRVWTACSPPGRDRGIYELAHELGMSPSTTHRYVSTLVEVGLLERTDSRKYRIPSLGTDADRLGPGGAR